MVDLLSGVVGCWLAVSIACAVVGFLIWNFPDKSDDMRLGSRMFLVAPVWPIAFVVWLAMNFRRLLADAEWGSR